MLVPSVASQEVKFEPKQLFLKRANDVTKIGFEADFRSPETGRCLPTLDLKQKRYTTYVIFMILMFPRCQKR